MTTTRIKHGPAGFTVLFREGRVPAFCQQVSHVSPVPLRGDDGISITGGNEKPGEMVLNVFEEWGDGEVASKVWRRLFPNLTPEAAGTKVIKFMRGSAVANIEPYMEEYHNVIVVDENSDDNLSVGTMEIKEQVTLVYSYITRRGMDPR